LIIPAISNASLPHRYGLYKNHIRSRPAIRHLKGAISKAEGLISPISGPRRIAVILVNFNPQANDANSSQPNSGSSQLTTTDILGFQTTLGYLKNFYNEASYGKLSVNITYFYSSGSGSAASLIGNETPFTLNHSMSYYGYGDESGSDSGLLSLMSDAGSLVDPGVVNSKNFDTIIVAHAGYGNESTSNDGDIWSAFVPLSSPVNGIDGGIAVPARESSPNSPIGVTCHEFGHSLGLLDVYKTTTPESSVVGEWCLMDYGPWVNNGLTPTHPSVWNKKYLGWLTPNILTSGADMTSANSVELSSMSVYQLPILGNTNEYFLICNTQPSPYNPNSPGSGLLIWHIDEGEIDGTSMSSRISNNELNDYSHNTLSLVIADNSPPSQAPYGDSTNPWPGTKINFTSPDSDSYTGTVSGISIINIGFTNKAANFSVIQIGMSSTEQINSVLNYPNPAGKGQFHPRQGNGTITTIVLNLSKLPTDVDLTIYDLIGQKVLDVGIDKFTFNETASKDFKVVYEYDWNGKNDDQKDVAPGVYFYRVRVGGNTKIGKMAIIR
jgi:immune inhibitor A